MWASRRISKLEDRSNNIYQSKEQKQKKSEEKTEQSQRLWNKIKHTNLHITGVPEVVERRREGERERDRGRKGVRGKKYVWRNKGRQHPKSEEKYVYTLKAQQLQTGKKQRDPHLDTSKWNCQKTETKNQESSKRDFKWPYTGDS